MGLLLSTADFESWFKNKGSSALDFLIKVIICIVLFWILSKILKSISNKLQDRLDKRNVDQIASHFVINLVRYFILIFAVFTIITQLNVVKEASIAALVASAGVGVSLAMQGALSNFAGGVLLLMLKPFKKGDYIVIPSNNVEGTVEEIQTYYTTIRTVLNESVKIPNSQLTNNSVINRAGNDSRALLLKVNVSYKTDIDKAKRILAEILDAEEYVLENGKSVFVEELGEGAVVMGILCMVPVLKYNDIRRSMNENIIKTLHAEGIDIPYNQLDVHIVNEK